MRKTPDVAGRAARAALLLVAAVAAAAAVPEAGESPDAAVRAMLRPIVTAPEVTARVLLERSDPFGGPPSRERGRLWYVPGRGLRYRSEKKNGQDVLIDRARESFLLYSPGDSVLYRAPFARAPSKLRRLIVDPEAILEEDLHATPERRSIRGSWRAGYRLRPAATGDSLRDVVTWIGADPKTGLPRWIAIDSEAESVLVELEGLAPKRSANARDLSLSAPPGTREEPLDPRELLGETSRGESR